MKEIIVTWSTGRVELLTIHHGEVFTESGAFFYDYDSLLRMKERGDIVEILES